MKFNVMISVNVHDLPPEKAKALVDFVHTVAEPVLEDILVAPGTLQARAKDGVVHIGYLTENGVLEVRQ